MKKKKQERKIKERAKCSIPECQEQARCSGLCPACYSWTHRMRYYSAGQLSTYLYRQRRMHSRIGLRYSQQAQVRKAS
jgi:hypothetical protein